MRKYSGVMSDERIRYIFALRDQGMTFRQIVKEMKTSHESVAKYLDMGLERSLEYAQKIRKARGSPPKMEREDITGDGKAKLWLDSMEKGSFYSYMTGLAYFCAMVREKPSALINQAIGEIRAGKLMTERAYFTWLKEFETMLKAEGFAATTQSNYLTAVRSFYACFDIEMPKKKGGRRKKIRPLRENSNVEITKENIRELLDVTKYLRDKAITLAIVSSGLGRAEVRLMDVGDFTRGYDKETGICMLKDVWRVKTNTDFISFFSSEATTILWQYLKMERGITNENIKQHLHEPLFTATKDTYKGSHGLSSRLALSTIDQIFRNLAIRTGPKNAAKVTENGNTIFNLFHPHNLRKFFNTEMKNAGAPEIMVEYMMGHEIDPTKAAYYLRKPNDLKTMYLKYMPAVTVQPTETRVIETEEYKELKAENEVLRGEIEEIKAKAGTLDISTIREALSDNREAQNLIAELLAQKIVSKRS
jgi:integrase